MPRRGEKGFPMSKKSYSRPTLTVHGSAIEQTQQAYLGADNDMYGGFIRTKVDW